MSSPQLGEGVPPPSSLGWPARLAHLARLALGVVLWNRLTGAGASAAVATLRCLVPRRAPRTIFVTILHALLLAAVFEVVLYRRAQLRRVFPQVGKMFRRLGMQDFVEADQILPCAASHHGCSCERNALNLWTTWWRTFLPAGIATRMATGRAPLSGKLFYQLAFLFCSSGVPGYVFCLTKKATGRGTRAGVFVSAAMASVLASLLPIAPRSRERTVCSMWVGAGLAALIPAAYRTALRK